MKERYGVACSIDHDKHSFFIKWYGFWLKIRQKFEINKEIIDRENNLMYWSVRRQHVIEIGILLFFHFIEIYLCFCMLASTMNSMVLIVSLFN